jgi:hypothetical protein
VNIRLDPGQPIGELQVDLQFYGVSAKFILSHIIPIPLA